MDKVTIITETINIIENSLKDITSVSKISFIMGFSKNHLNRIFNNTLGLSVLDYMKMRKITEAIKRNKGNIIDNAFEYGFNSHEVFIRNCKRYFRKSPRELINISSWTGFKRLNDKSLWYICNKDNITQKTVKLPELVIKESMSGNIYIEGMDFRGIKSALQWDPNNTYKLIPKGIYYSFSTDNENRRLKDYIQFKYPDNEIIIEFKKGNLFIYYIRLRLKSEK